MNNFTAAVNLCRDPEDLALGTREVVKLRLADNTAGKNDEARFFGAIVSGPDLETARKLKSGDGIIITGTLCIQTYKAKKDGKGVKKGQTIKSDEMPFAKILQVTKSPSFFGDTGSSEAEDTSAPDIDAPADASDDPLADIV